MAKRLEEGKKRMIHNGHGRDYKIVAECVDWDTPYIHIMHNGKCVATLTDSDARLMIGDLTDALCILPTSK